MIEEDLVSLVGPLVGGRVYPRRAPVGVTRPYVTFLQVWGRSISPLGPEVPIERHSVMQINVWAHSASEATSIALQIDEAMRTATVFVARPDGEFVSIDEPDLDLYGTRQDFSIFGSRA